MLSQYERLASEVIITCYHRSKM